MSATETGRERYRVGGLTIDIDDDGTIKIASVDNAAGQAAKSRVEAITADVEVGTIYEGRVQKLMDFGAFVNILPGKDGLVHISPISHERVENVSDKLSFFDRAGPPCLRRNADATFEKIALTATENRFRHAQTGRRIVGHRSIVGHANQQRILGDPQFIQFIHNLANEGIQVLEGTGARREYPVCGHG